MNLTELSKKIYFGNKAKGFWETQRDIEELFMLVITEASEAVESHRKGRNADMVLFNRFTPRETIEIVDKNNLAKSHFIREFELNIKDSIQDELADTLIRLLDYAGHIGFVFSPVITVEPITTDNYGAMSYRLTKKVIKVGDSVLAPLSTNLSDAMHEAVFYCFSIAAKLDINLERHVELKLLYNSTRPYKHGKKY